MATIATEQRVITLVNVFTVSPERQQEVVDELVEATRSGQSVHHSYISANIHRSLDGTRVVNYAQWRRVEYFQAMPGDEAATEHRNRAEQLAVSIEPHLYEVVFADQADASAQL